ncbi:MAG: hypothetical protein HY700_14540 [Gemmatimonadetes bacterium]|nr:hypothetical protein [Gemmatimonadota bacterium]
MIEVLIVLLILGAAMVVFYPVLAGSGAPAAPRRLIDRSESNDADEQRALLIERKERLFRSLSELEAERAAGRMAEADYVDFKRRDEMEAARVLREIEAADLEAEAVKSGKKPAAKPKAPPVSAKRKIGTAVAWVGGTVAFAAILGITMSKAVAPRDEGGTITGSLPGGGEPIAASGGGTSPMLPKADPARLAELEKVVKRDSSNVKALVEAGHLYLGEQKLDQAAQVTIKALTLDPQSAEAHAHIAVLLMAEASSHQNPDSARRSVGGALSAANRALELDPKLAEGWLFKGMIMMAGMQDLKGAAQAWEEYLKVAPPGADTMRIHALVEAAKSSGGR